MTSEAITTRSQTASNFHTRVARRIIALFALCTLLPVLAFVFFALLNVSSQLEKQAVDRLGEACKSSGMTVLERLGNIVVDIRLALENGPEDPLDALRKSPQETRTRLDQRLEWFALSNARSEWLAGTRSGLPLPGLSEHEIAHLDRMKKLLAIGSNEHGNAGLILVLELPRTGEDRYLFCKIRARYLWDDESFLPPNMDILAMTEAGSQLYTSRELPHLEQALADRIRTDPNKGEIRADEEVDSYLCGYRTMYTRPQFYRNFVIACSQSQEDVLSPIASFKRLFLLFAVLMICAAMFASLVLIRRSMVPIALLTEATRKIRDHDFSTRVEIRSKDEFRDLGRTFNGMAASLESHAEKMEALYRIGVALTAETSAARLHALVAESALSVCSADLVMIHTLDKNGRISTACIRSRFTDNAVWTEALQDGLIADQTSDAKSNSGTAVAAATGKTIHIQELTDSHDYDADLYKPIEEIAKFGVASALCIPMKNHDDETIGVMEMVHARPDEGEELTSFSLPDCHVAESLASQAAVAMTKNRLVEEFQHMFESLTELVATAIDEKSQYTGDHCRRVPILTMMMADAVCSAKSGPYADFTLTPEELYELRIAALLHDCGKVTTPEHIIDKATKLEKVFDRIELVDCRFEVVRSNLTIDHLNSCMATDDKDEIERLAEELAAAFEAIEKDRDFLRTINIGQESMSPEDQLRVQRIADEYSWTGPDGEPAPFLTEDEVENLCIRRGTLNTVDREIVNYHIVATILMLEKLPFPNRLARVPEIAGAHHEKMDGTGYPKGLKREEISVQGRILGICDLFEALTAKDRPYKPGKTLSETFAILGRLKEIGHMDPELFDLFIESGVYLEYAKTYLDPEQIDDFDPAEILAIRSPIVTESAREEAPLR